MTSRNQSPHSADRIFYIKGALGTTHAGDDAIIAESLATILYLDEGPAASEVGKATFPIGGFTFNQRGCLSID